MLTPERCIDIQANLLGADISMQLDECTDYPSPHEKAAESMRLSLRWGQRSLAAFGERETQTLFAIIQGSVYEDLRLESIQQSVAESTSGGYGGYAIGGLAVGEGHAAMCDVLDFTAPHLPIDRPRYLMGVGKPIDLVEAVARGVDMFDCVIPTRSGSQTFSKAYVHHLVRSQELLGAMILSWHNIAYFQDLMARMRRAISESRFDSFLQNFRSGWG